jgi:hypothetical protein
VLQLLNLFPIEIKNACQIVCQITNINLCNRSAEAEEHCRGQRVCYAIPPHDPNSNDDGIFPVFNLEIFRRSVRILAPLENDSDSYFDVPVTVVSPGQPVNSCLAPLE